MSSLRLRKIEPNAQGEQCFNVFMTMEDGYDLRVGAVNERIGSFKRQFWVWSCIGANGQAETREAALIALRAAWDKVTPDQIAAVRKHSDFTAWKYAIWDIGGKFETADPAGTFRFRKCPCGATLDCWDQAAVLSHVGHIEATRLKG